jgi:NAD(P)-dependent dehydrogenase (short-subunit alcohol dehydrogenase family)
MRQAVFCSTMAANRDPRQFDDPDRLVIDRSPNRHVGVGFATHFCLGAQLARLEAQIVIPRVLARFPKLRLACEPEELSWHPTIVGRTNCAGIPRSIPTIGRDGTFESAHRLDQFERVVRVNLVGTFNCI